MALKTSHRVWTSPVIGAFDWDSSGGDGANHAAAQAELAGLRIE
ncbi:MAG: hypothetical protein QNL92_04370 [Octadecabacter sp.]